MYIEVAEGWRYRPGGRMQVEAQLAQLREEAGKLPLRPEVPGLIARLWGTDPNDPDTGVHVMVWESKEAADRFRQEEDRTANSEVLDMSGMTTRGLDGMYFAHR